MSGSDVTVKRSKGDSTLVRPRFGPGMLLQHEDLEGLSAYPRDLSRLIFRSFFGCGVVCGLVVETEVRCGKVYVTVGAGLAIGCSGDPIHVPKDHHFAIDEECDPDLSTPLWVVLCGTTKCCAPRPSTCGSDEDEAPAVCTRERDGFEVRVVREWPGCACGCPEIMTGTPPPPPPPPTQGGGDTAFARVPREHDCACVDPNDPCYYNHYQGICGCACGDCPDCECKCVVLARLDKYVDEQRPWRPDHRVRRFIRPLLMRDPQVEREAQAIAQVDLREKQAKEAEAREAEAAVLRKLEKELADKAHRERKSPKPQKPPKTHA